MIIDLRQLDENEGHLSTRCVVELEDAFERVVEVPCELEVGYRRSGGAYYLEIGLSGRLRTACHRCLEPVDESIEDDFRVVIRRGGERDGAGGDEAGDYLTVGPNEHEVSLAELIHEHVVVNVPMIVVCGEDCKGLCPSCGKNQNKESCSCAPGADPRWAPLRGLSSSESNG